METSFNGVCSGLLRIKAVAARLGVSPRTVYRLVAEGQLKILHVRGCACIEERGVQDFIERSKGVKRP
jgi:excisionase family DNA binding protein